MKVSPVGIGTYELQLDVADAMEPGIVNDMEVSLNGTPLKLGKDCKSYPAVVIAQFSTDAISAAPVWEFTFKFAKLMSPSERGSDDSRSLAIRLRTLKLKKV